MGKHGSKRLQDAAMRLKSILAFVVIVAGAACGVPVIIPTTLHPHGYLIVQLAIGHVPFAELSIPAMQPREFTLQVRSLSVFVS
jgi:hypothetical protein